MTHTLTKEQVERHLNRCEFEVVHSNSQHIREHYRELAEICLLALASLQTDAETVRVPREGDAYILGLIEAAMKDLTHPGVVLYALTLAKREISRLAAAPQMPEQTEREERHG